MKKKLLVDLSFLDNLYCGYGQIALNYGKYFKDNYCEKTSSYILYLIVPKGYIGAFGDDIKYLSSDNWFLRHSKYLFPRVDVWHCLQFPSKFKPYSNKTKYIYTLHDLNCLDINYSTNQKIIDTNYRRIARNIKKASVVTTVSNFSKKEQIEKFFDLKDKPCILIYNGVEQLCDKKQTKPNYDIKEPFFFYISAFREKKNFHSLLDLMKLMPDKNLYLAGHHNNSYGDFIKQRIEEEKIKNVQLLGVVSEEEKAWLYANCQAFLFPSLFEGFGLPVIEAMQFGKPVFSSKETSLKEIGSSYAYFWNNFRAEDMKQLIDENLEKFYASPHLSEEEKEYSQSFSYKNYFEQYERLYNNTLNSI